MRHVERKSDGQLLLPRTQHENELSEVREELRSRDEQGSGSRGNMYFIAVLVLLGTGLAVNSGEFVFSHVNVTPVKSESKKAEAVTSFFS